MCTSTIIVSRITLLEDYLQSLVDSTLFLFGLRYGNRLHSFKPSFPSPFSRSHRNLSFTLWNEPTKRFNSSDVVIPTFMKGILQGIPNRTTTTSVRLHLCITSQVSSQELRLRDVEMRGGNKQTVEVERNSGSTETRPTLCLFSSEPTQKTALEPFQPVNPLHEAGTSFLNRHPLSKGHGEELSNVLLLKELGCSGK